MILVCDIGNTNIVIGIYELSWKNVFRMETQKNETALHYSVLLNEYLWEAGINPDIIKFKVLSSVVPDLKDTFKELLQSLSATPVIVLDRSIYDILPLEITNPSEIGTDIVSNSLAATSKFDGDLLIIDFGTALTFTVVDSYKEILGVNIAPGIKIAIETLMSRTSQLPVVDLEFPHSPIGTNTTEAIQNGVLIGYIGLIKYMIKVIQSHLDTSLTIIGTGGLSSVICPHIGDFDHIEPCLTLDGLRIAGELFLKKNQLS
jgi:type III pantothenate kinase